MSRLQTICRVIERGNVNQAVRAYRTGRRLHSNMELFGEGTPQQRRTFEDKLEAALLRRIQKARHNHREALTERTSDVCLPYSS